MLWANLHLLFWLSLIPFVTGWMGENDFATLPVALYGVNLFMAGLAYYVLERTLIAAQGKESRLEMAVGAEIKGWASVGIYFAGIVATLLWTPWIGLGLYALVALMWLLPDRRIERALGRPMTAHGTLVPPEEKAALAAMMPDYIAEMARFVPGVRAGQPYPDFDLYWSEPNSRWPFWLNVDNTRAGFALVDHDAGSMRMAEFFVARPYRRRRVGQSAARRLIARFPGQWRITQRESNGPGIAFWHRVLDGFVAYDEVTTTTDAVRREQRFTFP